MRTPRLSPRLPLLACLALLTSLALPALAPADARACGAFFATETGQNLAIDAQRALMVVREDTIDLHLQLAADTDGRAFSWVVPVPANPTLALGDKAVFAALDTLTTPLVTIERGGGGGGGGLCAGDAKAGLDGGFQDRGIQHFGGGELGGYTYDIVAGGDAAALSGWLTDKGYVLPPTFGDAVAPYVEASVFVAVRLTPGRDETLDLQPLVVSYTRPFGSSLGYAFEIAKLSTPTTAPLLLWVLADKRYRIANYGSIELERVAITMRDRYLPYAEALTELTDEAGGRLAVTEFAKDLEGIAGLDAKLAALLDADAHYLTRLYAEVPAASMEDLVITFAADAPDVEPAITVSHGPPGTHETGVMVACALGVIALRRRRDEPRAS